MEDMMREGMDAVRAKAEDLGETASDLAAKTSDKMSGAIDYFRSRNVNDMAKDVQDLVRKYPGGAMLAAVGVGFLAAHYLRHRREESDYGA